MLQILLVDLKHATQSTSLQSRDLWSYQTPSMKNFSISEGLYSRLNKKEKGTRVLFERGKRMLVRKRVKTKNLVSQIKWPNNKGTYNRVNNIIEHTLNKPNKRPVKKVKVKKPMRIKQGNTARKQRRPNQFRAVRQLTTKQKS